VGSAHSLGICHSPEKHQVYLGCALGDGVRFYVLEVLLLEKQAGRTPIEERAAVLSSCGLFEPRSHRERAAILRKRVPRVRSSV